MSVVLELLVKWFPGLKEYIRLIEFALIAAIVAAAAWWVHERDAGIFHAGAMATQAKWDAAKLAQQKADLEDDARKAEESKRRFHVQEINQEKQNAELAKAHDDAARAAAVAARVQRDAASDAEQWKARLADSPTRADLEAAGATIGVLADLLGKSRERSRVLASYADAASAAGRKCERDYDALTPPGASH